MPKKKKEVKKVEKEAESNLLDELGELDTPEENKDDETVTTEPEEVELSIVDQFVAGDMDAVKQTIQDQVIKTVSGVVNGTPTTDAVEDE